MVDREPCAVMWWARSFFTTLGVPVLAGRDFADSDTASSPHVGIINEEFARRFLPNQNPLGHVIGTDDGQYQMTIVGVVKNHKYRSIDEEPIPMAWYEYAQIPIIGRMDVEMRVHGEPLAILPAARKVVQQIDPEPAADSAHDAARAIRTDHLQARCSSRGWRDSLDCWRSRWWPRGSMARWPIA